MVHAPPIHSRNYMAPPQKIGFILLILEFLISREGYEVKDT
jgi:hypothetical protein